MRHLLSILLSLSAATPLCATDLQMVRARPGVDLSRHQSQMAGLSPSLREWVAKEARSTFDSGVGPDPAVIAGDARQRLRGQDFSDADIESVVQRVMMEAARQADADLHDAMAQMRAANENKARMRGQVAARKDASQGVSAAARAEFSRAETKAVCVDPPCQFSVIPIQGDVAQAKIVAPAGPLASPEANPDRDSMSELSQEDQMRMQMYMDRRSKAMQALSNLLKKSSDTSETIISNLK